LFARYLSLLVLAEALGIATVASVYAALDRGLLDASAWVLAAGACEGLFLGAAQALVLGKVGVRSGAPVLLTVLGAVAGYGLSLLGGAGGPDGGAEPGLALMALFGLGMGLGMGAVMGVIQLPALGPRLPRLPWVLFTTLGWMPAMAIIMLGAATASRDWPLWQVALSGGLYGGLAGACVALATWQVIRRIPNT
jgi:hypothetical protein